MREQMINQTGNAEQSPDTAAIVCSGDLVLDVEQPDHWLAGIAPALQAADLAIGHLEVPHTRRGSELAGDVPAPGADPAHLAALARAGFAAVTLAGNHIADCGPLGIADTVAELERLGIAHCGAGADLAQARAPAILRCGGRQVAVLSYNCVGPEAGWAAAGRAGCAYLRVASADNVPVTPTASLLRPAAEALEVLRTDVVAARRAARLVIVALHKGIVHTPARLAPYERPLAQAAIEAGADIVIGHHAHIIRGIEFHHGRPVYHGLGNGCVVTRALDPDQTHAARADWARERRRRFGFEPDPAYTLAPFHPEAVNAMLARVLWHADGSLECGVIPLQVEPPGRPVLADQRRRREIEEYLLAITDAAGLPPRRLLQRSDMTVVQ
jgi:poly-gamma-glutamate capsule biosynthesis protein CapA/YwtB (metallophosphatase superfamily)